MIATRRRRRYRLHPRTWRLIAVWSVLFAVGFGYVAGLAGWQALSESWIGFWDLVPGRIVELAIAAWFFFIGSSIGSFLNVVAWRMPRHQGINGRSHCPRCDHALGWRENWPVFGWLVLGGRCRSCRLPISARYPIVEALVGLTIWLIATRTFYCDTTQLPFRPPIPGQPSPLWGPYVSGESLVVISYHAAALSTLWAMALIRFDSTRLPRVLVKWCLAIVAIPMLLVPYLAFVPWTVSAAASWTAGGDYLNAVMRVLTGAAAGVTLARVLGRYLCPAADPKFHPLGEPTARLIDLSAILTVVAILVGWQAAIAVTVIAVLLAIVTPSWLTGRTDPLARVAIALPFAVTLQLGWWAVLDAAAWWPGVNTAPVVTLAWIASLLILPQGLVSESRGRAIRLEPDRAESD